MIKFFCKFSLISVYFFIFWYFVCPFDLLDLLTWLRCTGLSVPLLSYGKSFSNQSYSGLDALPLQGVVLRCSWSDLCISAGGVVKSYLYAWYGYREWGILATCPNQVNCRLLISWVMVLSIWSSRLMLTFLTLSHSLTPAMVLRHRISNASSLFLSIFRSVQDSEPYVAIGKIRAL